MTLEEFEFWWRNDKKKWLQFPQAQKMAAKAAWDAVEEKFTSTNKFQLPVSVESCIDHLCTIWNDINITSEVRCAVEETHEFIERQMQTLL